MPFPTTGLISAFTGADEDPISESGAWSSPTQVGASNCRRLSNACKHSASGATSGQIYRVTPSYGPDVEAWGTVATLPGAAAGVIMWGRITNPGTGTMQAYIAVYTVGTGFQLWKCLTGSTFTQLGSTNAATMSAGEKLGLECISTAIKCWHFTGGSWINRVSATDSSITGSGLIGLEITDGTGIVDDFSGGTVVVAGGAQTGDMLTLGVGG